MRASLLSARNAGFGLQDSELIIHTGAWHDVDLGLGLSTGTPHARETYKYASLIHFEGSVRVLRVIREGRDHTLRLERARHREPLAHVEEPKVRRLGVDAVDEQLLDRVTVDLALVVELKVADAVDVQRRHVAPARRLLARGSNQ